MKESQPAPEDVYESTMSGKQGFKTLRRCDTSGAGRQESTLLIRHPAGYVVVVSDPQNGFVRGSSHTSYSGAHAEYALTLRHAVGAAYFSKQMYVADKLPPDDWTDEIDRRIEEMVAGQRYVSEAKAEEQASN